MSGPAIGSLRRRVTIEVPVATADGAGGATLGWSVVGAAWARIEAERGRETLARGQFAADEPAIVWLRWRADLTAAHRLRDGARVLTIHSATDPDGRRRWLRIVAEEERT